MTSIASDNVLILVNKVIISVSGSVNARYSLLAMIALSAVQSDTRTLIHNAILFTDTSAMLDAIKFIG